MSQADAKNWVIHSHDGGIDDFLALLLLTTLPSVELLAAVVTPADCYLEAALSVTRKLLQWRNLGDVEAIASPLAGINPFPHEYRRDCRIIDRLPLLNEQMLRTDASRNRSANGETGLDRIRDILWTCPAPVTWLETGPLTTLATLLSQEPSLKSRIKQVIWMGGALAVPGNVEPQFAPDHNGSAEWNVFWDPVSAQAAVASGLPLTLCPLDATNTVPVTPDFTAQLARQRRFPCSDFAGQCYAIAALQNYYCWDVLTAAYVGAPELFEVDTAAMAIDTQAPSQGRTRFCASGHAVRVIHPRDPQHIRAYLLRQWSQ